MMRSMSIVSSATCSWRVGTQFSSTNVRKYVVTNNILLYVSTHSNYAACGAEDTTGYGFKREEFFILLVTQFMGDMLIKHGHDMFGIDSTHNTTLYGFKLISLMAVDEDSNAGYPVTFCLSSGESKFFLRVMFTEIMVRVLSSSKE